MIMKTTTLLAALAVWTMVAPANAITLVKYNLDDGTGLDQSIANRSDAADVVAANVAASAITAQLGTNTAFRWNTDDTPNPDVNSVLTDDPGNLNNNSDDQNTWWGRGTTIPNSLDQLNNPIIEWTTTATAGSLLLDTVDVRYALHDRNVGGVYNADIFLVNADTGTILDSLDLGTVDNNNRNYTYTNVSLDASGLGATTSATLRLYVTDNSGAGAKHTILDSITVQGVVIPEPTTATLGLIGLAGLLVRRRAA